MSEVLDKLVEFMIYMQIVRALSGALQLRLIIESRGVPYEVPRPQVVVVRPEVPGFYPAEAYYAVLESPPPRLDVYAPYAGVGSELAGRDFEATLEPLQSSGG